MYGRKGKKDTSWIFVYAALVASVIFANQPAATAPRDVSGVSPVVLGGEAPALAPNSIVRRSDI